MSLLESPLLLLLIGLAGYLLRGYRVARYRSIIARINVYLLLPILLFDSFAKRGFLVTDVWIASAAVIFTAVSLPLLLYLTRGMNWSSRASVLISAMLPNAINIPFPLLQATLGDYSYAAVYAVTINILQIIIVVILAGLVRTKTRRREEFFNMLKLMTPIYGALIGGLMHHSGLVPKGVFGRSLDLISDITIDSIVFAAGLSLPSVSTGFSFLKGGVGKILFWRHVFSPLLTLSYLLILTSIVDVIPRIAIAEVMVEAVMPPALINASFSLSYGFDAELTGRSIMYSTPIGIVLGVLVTLFFI